MTASTPMLTLMIGPVTPGQHSAISGALRLRIDECEESVAALEARQSGKTAVADYWRKELASAEQALEIVGNARATT